MPDSAAPPTPYERFGGRPFFEALVGGFYARIAEDPVIRPMYPEADLAPAAARLRLFLEQYWGGPGTYSEQRGHPRLRRRHAPFPIDPDAAGRWLAHMRASLDEQRLEPELDAELWHYLETAAQAMVNTFAGAGDRPLPTAASAPPSRESRG
ncbi:MAG: globin [Actinobacteria bacterium]|nr:globin [Actinomycetota bacterium]